MTVASEAPRTRHPRRRRRSPPSARSSQAGRARSRTGQSHFHDGDRLLSRRRPRAGPGRRRRPKLRPRHDGNRPLDQSGSQTASRRRSRPAPHVRRRARGQPARPRGVLPQGVLGTSPATDATAVLVSTAGTRVSVEISSVPLMSGERVVGVFGLVEESPDDTPTAPLPHLTPRQVEVLRLLEQGRSTKQIAAEAPPEHRNSQEPHSPTLPGPRRQLPTRSRRRCPRRITPLIQLGLATAPRPPVPSSHRTRGIPPPGNGLPKGL